jgi:hypothetical protein
VLAEKSAARPLAIGASTIDTPLAQLFASGHAIRIGIGEPDAISMACGDIPDSASKGGDVVLALESHREKNAENVGVAILSEEGARTAVTFYLLNPDRFDETEDGALSAPEETGVSAVLDGGPSRLDGDLGQQFRRGPHRDRR